MTNDGRKKQQQKKNKQKNKTKTTKSRKNQNALRKGNFQVLGNIGSGHYQTNGDERKKKNKKEHLRRTRKLLETKLYDRNFIKGINSWAVPFVRYSVPFLKWMREELQQVDQ